MYLQPYKIHIVIFSAVKLPIALCTMLKKISHIDEKINNYPLYNFEITYYNNLCK